jgi:hypothetical protein
MGGRKVALFNEHTIAHSIVNKTIVSEARFYMKHDYGSRGQLLNETLVVAKNGNSTTNV